MISTDSFLDEIFFNAVANTQAPRPDSGVCRECENIYFCSGCLVRALGMGKKIGESM